MALLIVSPPGMDDAEPTIPGAPAPRVYDAETTLTGHMSSPDDPRLGEMRARLGAQDFTAALELADSILAGDPENLEAQECRLRSHVALEEVYLALIGSLEQIPRIVISAQEVCALSLDSRTGFLLSRIDGSSTLDTILAVSGMGRLETMRALFELVSRSVVSVS